MTTETAPAAGVTERLFARGFTILGGVFWIVAAFAGPYIYGGRSLVGAFGVAVYPLVFSIAVLALGWYYERLASLVLAVAAIGTVAWGVIMVWEPNVWAIMLVFFIAPTVASGLLFFLAGSREAPRENRFRSGSRALS